MLGIKREEFSTVNTEAQRNFAAHSDLPVEFKDPETFETKILPFSQNGQKLFNM